MAQSLFDSCSIDRKNLSIDQNSKVEFSTEFSGDCLERLKRFQSL